MPIATSTSALPRPATFVKMEDRKRPASGAVDDCAPPSKRQAVNGGGKVKDDAGDMKEESWIEEYQKGAIYRQMLEYKRHAANLEARLEDVETKKVDHVDHIRIQDAWVTQLVQEIELLVTGIVPSPSTLDTTPKSALPFKDSKDFQRHLGDRAKVLKSKIESILTRLSSSRGDVKPDVAQLESQLKSALAREKELAVKLERSENEKTSLSEQLDTATLKVIKAERKLDRAKSAQVQKMEQQALANSTTHTGATEDNGAAVGMTNGESDELKLQFQEMLAVDTKRKEQLEALKAEFKVLQEENSNFKIKRETVSDEDYVRTDAFKQFKAQNEDLIKRINHLQATNKELREDAEKLRAERTAYRVQLEGEAQAVTLELEEQIQQKDQDLTRIRSARDELSAELSMRKASEAQEKTAMVHMKELIESDRDRIAELESEIGRLRPDENTTMTDSRPDIDCLTLDDLRQKYTKLEKDFEAINKELPLLEKSYKKAMALAHNKVMDFHALEERVAILTAEKSKADQKYFAARKDMDIRTAEIRTLRGQNGKSSEIISQLKDVESHTRALMSSLEKQLSDLKQSNATVMTESRRMESLSSEATRRSESIKAQNAELGTLVKAKDAAISGLKDKLADLDLELEKLKVRLKGVSKDCEKWKLKSQSNSTQEEEVLRHMVVCTICRSSFKDTIIKGCGHAFCSDCVESRLANRMRKCPSCNKAFDRSDIIPLHL